MRGKRTMSEEEPRQDLLTTLKDRWHIVTEKCRPLLKGIGGVFSSQVVSSLTSIAALVVALIAMSASSRFENGVTKNLKDISSVSIRLKESLEQLPQSVTKFDSTIQGMSKLIEREQSALQATIDTLGINVTSFSTSLQSYKEHLALITEASQKQLELLKKTQASWELEVSRKPDIRLVGYVDKIDSQKYHVVLELQNVGNQYTEKGTVILNVPREYKLQSSGWHCWDTISVVQQWAFSYDRFIGYSSTPGIAYQTRPFNGDFWVYLREAPPSGTLILKYTVFTEKLSEDGTLIFKTSVK
jgi:hypothetical protein